MKKRVVGAAAAAMLCASAAFVPATALDRPKAAAPAQTPGSHRISFAGGKAVYSGPLEDHATLPQIVQQSPDVTIEDAWRQNVHNSLRRLGAPEAVFPRDDKSHGPSPSYFVYEFVDKGHDWDKDGDADLLSITYSQAGTTYAAVNGQTGEELWHWHSNSGASYGEAATIGEGENGVLLVSYGGVGAVAAGTATARIVALGLDGSVRWETLYRGQFASAPFAGVVARDVPTVTGIGQLAGSPATDVVVARETWLSTLVSSRARTATDVVDGANGTPAWSTRGTWTDDPGVPWPTSDLTGDGLGDIVQAGYESLAVLRGTDGAEQWSATGLPVEYEPPSAVGDLTGDGRTDIAVANPYSWWYDDPLTTVLVNGATGATLATVSGGLPSAAGDVDGDGKGDVGTVEGFSEDGFVGVEYRAFDAAGSMLRTSAYGVHQPWDTNAYAEFWSVGDVQGDGSADWAHSVLAVDGDGLVREDERGVVSGRTGLRLWSGKVGHRAYGSIDGEGEDLLNEGTSALQAVDGTTGRELWVARTPKYDLDWSQVVGDVNGDGTNDVAAFMYGFSDEGVYYRPWVLSGKDGRLLWGRGALVVQPSPEPAAAPL